MRQLFPTSDRPPEPDAAQRDLRWLLTLRWFALAGQSATVLVAVAALPVPLFLPGLVAVLGVDLLFCALLETPAKNRFARRRPRLLILGLLALDTARLTLLLHWSGGAHNPFTSFYLLHIAIAAILLPRHHALLVAALSIAGFVSLHGRVLEWCGLGPVYGGIPASLHHQGMVVALALTGASLAWFVGGQRADLRRREAELRASEERLAREQRFAGLATLAAGVAHELATPLGTIALVSRELEHAAAREPVSASCLEDVRLIREQVDRCRAIIDRINTDASADLGADPEPIPLATLPDLLRAELPPASDARLVCSVAPSLAARHLEAPRLALLQALGVLVKNAVEADPSGAPVRLLVEEDAAAPRPSVAFVVRDSGVGLDPALRERVGEPFLTTKPAGQGMGLGLYIVRLFAERVHGRLELRSVPPGGAEARLVLPLKPSP